MTTPTHDPLAGLIERPDTPSMKADRWAERLLKFTLLCVFADIALFAVFSLVQTGLINIPQFTRLLEHWDYLAGATVAGVVATLLAGILKMSYELTE